MRYCISVINQLTAVVEWLAVSCGVHVVIQVTLHHVTTQHLVVDVAEHGRLELTLTSGLCLWRHFQSTRPALVRPAGLRRLLAVRSIVTCHALHAPRRHGAAVQRTISASGAQPFVPDARAAVLMWSRAQHFRLHGNGRRPRMDVVMACRRRRRDGQAELAWVARRARKRRRQRSRYRPVQLGSTFSRHQEAYFDVTHRVLYLEHRQFIITPQPPAEQQAFNQSVNRSELY